MEFDWTMALEILLYVLVVIGYFYFLPWLKAKVGEAKLKQIHDEFKLRWDRICVLVQAAQQMFPKGEDGKKRGVEKKEWVLEMLFSVYGVEPTEEDDALVEAAVHELT